MEEFIATKEQVEEWKKHYLSLGHTYPSTNTYYSFIKRFVGEGTKINQKVVDKFREKNMSCPASSSLKNFFKFLVNKKACPADVLNIRFERSITKRIFPKSITRDEVEIIIENMPEFRLKVLTRLLYDLALRISEGMKIKWEDINFVEWLNNKDDFGKVNLKNTKRGKFAVMPVRKELMEMLYSDDISKIKNQHGVPIGDKPIFKIGEGIESFIFRKEKKNEENLHDYIKYAENYYYRVLLKVSKAHIGKKVSAHVFRHSKAQHLLDAGMPIDSLKEFLRHVKISSTEVYAQASPEKVKKDLLLYDNIKPIEVKSNEQESN